MYRNVITIFYFNCATFQNISFQYCWNQNYLLKVKLWNLKRRNILHWGQEIVVLLFRPVSIKDKLIKKKKHKQRTIFIIYGKCIKWNIVGIKLQKYSFSIKLNITNHRVKQFMYIISKIDHIIIQVWILIN
jgi:uncharacterized UPF0160 family protein